MPKRGTRTDKTADWPSDPALLTKSGPDIPAGRSDVLLGLGARQWQVEIAGPILEEAINRPAPATTPSTADVAIEVTGE